MQDDYKKDEPEDNPFLWKDKEIEEKKSELEEATKYAANPDFPEPPQGPDVSKFREKSSQLDGFSKDGTIDRDGLGKGLAAGYMFVGPIIGGWALGAIIGYISGFGLAHLVGLLIGFPIGMISLIMFLSKNNE